MSGQTREQQRALHAYARVEAAARDKGLRADYKPRVNGLGAAVLRDGLAAALTFLERERESNPAARQVLDDLAWCLGRASLPKLGESLDGKALPKEVRGLDLDAYMLATRETIRLLVWFRRAVQATFPKEEGDADA
jgi:CRISPR-associated protein Cmr5